MHLKKKKKKKSKYAVLWYVVAPIKIQSQHRSFRVMSKLLWNHQLLPNINLSHTPHGHEGLKEEANRPKLSSTF